MLLAQQLAAQLREVCLKKDWVSTTSLKEQLENLTLEQANAKVGNHNSIALLSFHLNYYIDGISRVLEGGSLDISDKYAFNAPPVQSQKDWDSLRQKLWNDVERLAELIEQMPEADLDKPFANLNYGSNYKNINAMIQHVYYHLGQIVLIRKLLSS